MGSTIITKRLAAVFDNPANRGDHIWTLFEKTYESNVHPHTPHWSVRAIGRIDGALRSIFSGAAACEGGSLRGRSGSISPETHIDRWMAALRHPVVMPDRDIRLTKDDILEALAFPWRQGVEEAWSELGRRVKVLGMESILDALDQGEEIALSLYQDVEAVIAICGESSTQRALLSPCQALGGYWAPESASAASIGYFPAGGEVSAPTVPRTYRINDFDHLIERDGAWKEAGWAYSIIGQYVSGLFREELRAPGSYRVLIPPYRKALENAPLVPEGTYAIVKLAQCDERQEREVRDIIAEAGGGLEQDPDATQSLLARIPWTAAMGRRLAYLPREATTWHLANASTAQSAA